MRSQPAAPSLRMSPVMTYHYLIGPTTEGAKEVRERPNSR